MCVCVCVCVRETLKLVLAMMAGSGKSFAVREGTCNFNPEFEPRQPV